MTARTWATSPAASLRWSIGPGTLTVGIDAQVCGIDAAWLRLHLPRLLAFSGAAVVICDLRRLREPDLSTVDAVARVRGNAERLGQRLQVYGATEPLHGLCALVGLRDILLPPGPSAPVCARMSSTAVPRFSGGRRTGHDRPAPARGVPTPRG